MASRPFIVDQHVNTAVDAYSSWVQYGNSKLCNMLFSVALAKRHEKDKIVSFSLHPGVIATNLGRHQSACAMGLFQFLCWSCQKSIPQGAATQTYCATRSVFVGTFSSCVVFRPRHIYVHSQYFYSSLFSPSPIIVTNPFLKVGMGSFSTTADWAVQATLTRRMKKSRKNCGCIRKSA